MHTTERQPWTAAQAVASLDHCHRADDRLTDLFELAIGTGMRRGEALALHWFDVDLATRVLNVHRNAERCPMSPGDWCLLPQKQKAPRPVSGCPHGGCGRPQAASFAATRRTRRVG